MESEWVAKGSKKVRDRYHRHPEGIVNQIREEAFNNRYSLTERARGYEALSDPYTSYYFSTRPAKEHLRRLKRAIRYEPNETEKSKINQLLTVRIKEKFKDVLSPKTVIYEKELTDLQLDALGKKSSANLHKKKSRQSLASQGSE